MLVLCFVILIIFFFPVFVHFELSGYRLILQPFLIAIFSPVESLISLLILIGTFVVFNFIPGLIPLVYMTLPVSLMMQVMYHRFSKLLIFDK
ncbi:hypothetical protein BAU16_01990 [Enterococcus sp. JM9B]|nr:hypothetical protein BAU16_01990 [Enterococcus sp. JM9B]